MKSDNSYKDTSFCIGIYKLCGMECFYMKIFVLDKWKAIRYVVVLTLLCFVFTFAGNITTEMIATMASASRKLPIYNIETSEPKISLTFDCAWGESR